MYGILASDITIAYMVQDGIDKFAVEYLKEFWKDEHFSEAFLDKSDSGETVITINSWWSAMGQANEESHYLPASWLTLKREEWIPLAKKQIDDENAAQAARDAAINAKRDAEQEERDLAQYEALKARFEN